MKLIIKTGFEKISHSIDFTHQKIKNGIQLSRDGHVRDVTETRDDGEITKIDAQIIRTTTVSLRYETNVNVSVFFI